MKKFLFFTSALFASAAFADIQKVEIGGQLVTQLGFSDQTRKYGLDQPQEAATKFLSKATIGIDATGKTDRGLTYGAAIKLKSNELHDTSDGNGGFLGDQLNVSQSYVYIEGAFGNLKAGVLEGGSKLKSTKFKSLGGSGGAVGDWTKFVSDSIKADPPPPPAEEDLDEEDFTEEEELFDPVNSENKITYTSPQFFKALRGSIEFTPHTKLGGTSKAFYNRKFTKKGSSRNVLKFGLVYDTKVGPIAVNVCANTMFGESTGKRDSGEPLKVRNLRTYDGSIKLTYKDFMLGYAYNNRGKSDQLITANATDSVRQVVTGSYGNDTWNFALSYLSNDSFNKLTTAKAASIDYQLAPGFVPYVEGVLFNIKPDKHLEQKGNVIILGTKFNF